MKLRNGIVGLLVGAALPAGFALAQTEIQTMWNCKDRDGKPLLTNQKEDTVGKECRIVQQQRVTVVPASQASSPGAAPGAPPGAAQGAAPSRPVAKTVPSPAGFPKETANDRSKGREKQRQMLEGELTQEEQLLASAKRELATQESTRSGDERNYAKVLERLQKYRDNVEVHEKNIEALKRELANLR